MRKSLRLVTIALCFCLSAHAQVIYSVQAHQDDWQLFMSSRILNDLSGGADKVVFITLTAGEQGCPGCQYYLQREKGAVYSSKFISDLTSGTTPADLPTAATVTVNSHSLTKYTYKNIVNYFFRLPDGQTNGVGFPATGNQSLQKLYLNTIPTITAINHTSSEPAYTYTKASLEATIKAIIDAEKITGKQGWLHGTSLNTSNPGSPSNYNPGDHSDHLYSATAAQNATATGYSWIGITEFMNYASSTQLPNLSNTEHENAAITFGLEAWSINEGQYQNEYNSVHLPWMPMDYYAVKRAPTGTAFAGIAEDENNGKQSPGLTKIPMVVSSTSPALAGKNIQVLISPYEPGELVFSIYNATGNKQLATKSVKIEKREPTLITLSDAVTLSPGMYQIKFVLNNRYTETLKITVE